MKVYVIVRYDDEYVGAETKFIHAYLDKEQANNECKRLEETSPIPAPIRKSRYTYCVVEVGLN